MRVAGRSDAMTTVYTGKDIGFQFQMKCVRARSLSVSLCLFLLLSLSLSPSLRTVFDW